jgi:hypothetical protein
MKLRFASLALLIALAGCGDLKDSRCDPPEPHHCLVLCCDPACSGAGNGNSCSNAGYECQFDDSSLCTCGSDGKWHCTGDSAPEDLSVHVVTDMARPPGD